MPRASLILRLLYAACLAGATCVHVALHVRYGVFLEALAGGGFSVFTRAFWSLLTLLDPLAAVLMFAKPRVGLALAAAIIVCDVAHNSWIVYHFGGRPDAAYWAQIAFMIFLAASITTAWRGLPRATFPKNENIRG